ncbi:MAG: sigma-70 family RNA polymerase sigma factor [Planctomycetota bacterium]
MPPTTRISLITRIGEADDKEAWADFVQLYGPLVYTMARKRGLQDADACDLMQDVMREVARSVDRFDPDPKLGRFRGWLGVITQRTLARHFAKSRRQVTGAGGSTHNLAIAGVADQGQEDVWDLEHRRHLFRWAAERIRGDFAETTWRAFWLTAVDGASAQQAADQCGISVGAVYIAKSRVLSRLRERIEQHRGSGH